jgi:hypothetical protein
VASIFSISDLLLVALQSGPAEDDPHDPFLKFDIKIELATRHYFIWRFLKEGVNTLWTDTDVHVTRNPYPYFKNELKDVNLILRDHTAQRVEMNTGIMYAQDVHPEGPVATIFKQASIFSISDFLLVASQEYSLYWTSYWSHGKDIFCI